MDHDQVAELSELVDRAGLSRSDPRTKTYVELPSEEQIDELEASLGHQLPPEVRWLLEHHSGTKRSTAVRTPWRVRTDDGSKVVLQGYRSIWRIAGFGTSSGLDVENRCALATHLLQFDNTPEMPLLRPVEELIDDVVPRLVPLTPAMHGTCLCLDFRHDPANPPIINIDSQAIHGADHRDGLRHTDWATYLAPSLTELLRVADRDPDYLESLPDEPYKFADEMTAWEQSFDTYISQWSPIKPRYKL